MENCENSHNLKQKNSDNINGQREAKDVMELYLQSLKMNIENDSPELIFSIKEIKQKSELLIVVKILKQTKTNPFMNDIYFHILVKENFPESAPEVYCKTNFCFPSLYDHRNLLTSLLTYKWQAYTKLSKIVEGIPNLIHKYSSDIKNKILTYYGEYKINSDYCINDFFGNQSVELFKLQKEAKVSISNKEIVQKRETVYLMITDIYILKFVPCQLKCCDKNKPKLAFLGELKDIKEIKQTKIYSSEEFKKKSKDKGEQTNNRTYTGFIISLNKPGSSLDGNFIIESDKIQNFINLIETRRNLLLTQFSFFQDDLMKLNTHNFLTKVDEESTQNLITLIEYREQHLDKEYNEVIMKDLMIMYQKVIEIFSSKNDERFMVYIEKLQNLINKCDMAKENILEGDESFSILKK